MMGAEHIAMIGDPHGALDKVNGRLLELRPRHAVIVGDMVGYGGPPYDSLRDNLAPVLEAGIQVHWIPGNHDADRWELLEATFGSMPAENFHGRVIEAEGVRLAGVGGVFRGKVWRPPEAPVYAGREEHLRLTHKNCRYKGGLAVRHWTSIHPSDISAFYGLTADVLVTHEASSAYSHGDVHGFAVFDELAASLSASVAIHGHHHWSYARRTPAGLLTIGLGLGEVSLLSELIVAGEREGPLPD